MNKRGLMLIPCHFFLATLLTAFLPAAPTLAADSTSCRCHPQADCWPKHADWQRLQSQLQGSLTVLNTQRPCQPGAEGVVCSLALLEQAPEGSKKTMSDTPRATQVLGPGQKAVQSVLVTAQDEGDVMKAVNFARQHKLRVMVEQSHRPGQDSEAASGVLQLSTRHLDGIRTESSFQPVGCSDHHPSWNTVTVGAGSHWADVYKKVTLEGGRYVQGGGGAITGVVSHFMQDGGFGSFSKRYGIGAASIVQAKLVTADGKLRIANACQNQDLLWALKGGGDSTFGIITELTMKTYPLPETFGIVEGKISSRDDKAYQQLIQRFLTFYRDRLNSKYWGEQVTIHPDNSLNIFMLFQDLTATEANKRWQAFMQWLDKQPSLYQYSLNIDEIPAKKLWDYDYLNQNYPQLVSHDRRKKEDIMMGGVLAYHKSRYLPMSLLANGKVSDLSTAFLKASRIVPFSLHFSKGLAGASIEAITQGKTTPLHPDLFNAAALIVMADNEPYAYPHLNQDLDNPVSAWVRAEVAEQAFNEIRALIPSVGSNKAEGNQFEKAWQQAFWGRHYSKLLRIKRRVDPEGLFYCYHCIGSELLQNREHCAQTSTQKTRISGDFLLKALLLSRMA